MQSWADIDSESDDDSAGQHHPANQVQPEPEPEQEESEEEEPPPPPKEYDWPSEPPFTAYVGNFPYKIKDSDELSRGIEHLLHDRFQASVRIVKSRLAMDRQENRPKGFGYLELESLEDLQTVLRLNDGKSMFKGRPLKLDVASPPSNQNNGSRRSLNRSNSKGNSRGNLPEVDGSSFRGGRFNKRDSSSSSLRRQSSVSSDTSETRQRPSLKLAPRSKPVEGDNKESSSSSLFGSGRARDDAQWERRRSDTKQQDRRGTASTQDRRGSASSQERRGSASSQERRGSASSTGGTGRGGGGGGGRGKGKGGAGGNKQAGGAGGSKQAGGAGGSKQAGGRGGGGRGGGGRGKGSKDGHKKAQPKEQKDGDAAPKPTPKAPPVVEPTKPSTSVQNKFSALNMDSDSD